MNTITVSTQAVNAIPLPKEVNQLAKIQPGTFIALFSQH